MVKKKITIFMLVVVLFISAAPTVTLGAFEGLVRILVPPTLVFDAVYTFRDGLAWVRRDGQSGFVNRYGEEVIPLQFDTAAVFFHEGLAGVGRHGEAGLRFGYIDKTGELVIPFQFTSAGRFRNGIAPVNKGENYGFINQRGEVVIPFVFSRIEFFIDDWIFARKADGNGSSMGVMDRYGNTVIPFKYAWVSYMGDGLFHAQAGGWPNCRDGILNRYNEVIVPFDFEWIHPFHEGLAAVERNGQVGFVNTAGQLVIPLRDGSIGLRDVDMRWRPRFALHGSFEDGFAVISGQHWLISDMNAGARLGLIDRMGHVVLPFEFDIIDFFSDGIAIVGKAETLAEDDYDDFWDNFIHTFGAIDKTGRFVVPIMYDSISRFSEGLASARLDGYTGLIDREGNVILPFEYRWIGPFRNGVATAAKESGNGLIDRYGNVLIPFEHGWIYRAEDGLLRIMVNDRFVFMDYNGNILHESPYISISYVYNGVYKATRYDRQTGVMDLIDNNRDILLTLPRQQRIISGMPSHIPRTGGYFWLQSGTRETGLTYGIIQIADEMDVVDDPATEYPEDALVAEESEESEEPEEIKESPDELETSVGRFAWLFNFFRSIWNFFSRG